jgi:predicted nucleotidyltransferase
MTTPQQAQETLIERIVAAAHPERIILFGSRARGDHRPDSDFDVLVVFSEPISQPWTVARNLRAAVGVIGYGKDIIVTDHQHLQEEATLNGSIIGMALREGQELWPHAA